MDMYADEDPGMEKYMDMEMGKRDHKANNNSSIQAILGYPFKKNLKNEEYDDNVYVPSLTSKAYLSTVFEEDRAKNKSRQRKYRKKSLRKRGYIQIQSRILPPLLLNSMLILY